MQCPTCSTALSSTQHEGVPLHSCSTCSGTFVGYAELRQIVENEQAARSAGERTAATADAATAAHAAPDTAAERPCPECGTAMHRYVYQYDSGVWVDGCTDHGIWLDDGELERLEALVEGVRRGAVVNSHPESMVGTDVPAIAQSADYRPFDSPFMRQVLGDEYDVLRDT